MQRLAGVSPSTIDRNHWHFNGCVLWLKTLPNLFGGVTWYDLSGYGANGTLTSMDPPTDWVTTGGRPSLDLAGDNDFISVADDDRFTFATGVWDSEGGVWVYTDKPAGFTVMGWVRMRDATSFRFFSKASGASAAEWFFGTNPSDCLVGVVYGGSTSASISQAGNSAITSLENTWAQGAMTYTGSGANTGISLYLNGAVVASTAGSAGTYTATANTNAPVEVGRLLGSLYANGQVDDVRIYNRCMTPTEIQWIYQDSATQRYEALTTRKSWYMRVPDPYVPPATNRRRRLLICGA